MGEDGERFAAPSESGRNPGRLSGCPACSLRVRWTRIASVTFTLPKMANPLTYIVDLKTQIPIYARDEFSLGRDSPQLEHAHGTISKRHVKFHCIVFEDDGQWSIPPLVYAEDVSTNGTYLRRAQTPVEDQPDPRGILMRSSIRITLLEENDELWFHPSVFLRYHVNKDLEGEDPPFPSAVQTDMKASQTMLI